MLKLPIPEQLFDLAQERADAMPVLNGSHRGAAGNEVGCLGEVVVEALLQIFDIDFEFLGATSHDLNVGQEKWEVKTKDRTVVPIPTYDCSVPLYNIDHQMVDRYVFVSLLRRGGTNMGVRRFPTAFVLGVADRDRILSNGRIWKAGEIDKSNGTKFWTDCINLPISKLDSVIGLFNSLQPITKT